MGTGKTIVALETAKRVGGKVLVIAPAFLERTWHKEAERHGVTIRFEAYSRLHNFVSTPGISAFDFWIADEVHCAKNPTARRTIALFNGLKAARPRYFIGLTGTPIKNRVPDFYTLIKLCELNVRGTSGGAMKWNYHGFARHFCHVRRFRVRGRMIERYMGLREERLPELKSLLIDKYIRFRVEDVLRDLPEIVRKDVRAEVGVNAAALLEEFSAKESGASITSTAKADSALKKATATAEYAELLAEDGSGPLLIFTDHVASAAAIAAALNARCITGATPMPIRQDAVEEFQARRLPFLVATIGALSTGVTLTAARHVIFNDLSWTPADNLQAEKRIHRIGQKSVCFAHYIEAGEVDAYIRKTLYQKLETIGKVVG